MNSVRRIQRRSRKCFSQSEARVAILFFSDQPENTNLVEHFEILLPVKFRWIPFRRKVENVSANQRPVWSSCFSDRPEKHKLGRGRWDLAPCQVSLNSVQRFQRRSRKYEKLTTDHRQFSALEPSAQMLLKCLRFSFFFYESSKDDNKGLGFCIANDIVTCYQNLSYSLN